MFTSTSILKYEDLPEKSYYDFQLYTKTKYLSPICKTLNKYLAIFRVLHQELIKDNQFVPIHTVKNYTIYNHEEVILLPDIETIDKSCSLLNLKKDKLEAWFYPLYLREIKNKYNQAFLQYLIHYYKEKSAGTREVSSDEGFYSLFIDWHNRSLDPKLLPSLIIHN